MITLFGLAVLAQPVPGGSRIREAGVDYVIVAHEDADGVESIRVHRLQRR